jgi:hypothetical protein
MITTHTYCPSQATGLISEAPHLREILGDKPTRRCVSKERMTILVSPSYYKQRKEFYQGLDCNVRPLLLEWKSLSANQIKCLMGIKGTDSQLYVSTMLNILKRYQREDEIPPAYEFFEEVRDACNVKGQEGPLGQRIALLESLIAESDINEGIRAAGGGLYSQCTPGHLVIADMTDPLMSKSDVNGLFQVPQLSQLHSVLFYFILSVPTEMLNCFIVSMTSRLVYTVLYAQSNTI